MDSSRNYLIFHQCRIREMSLLLTFFLISMDRICNCINRNLDIKNRNIFELFFFFNILRSLAPTRSLTHLVMSPMLSR